ncbi:MAG: queuine tRNA-ribosyltransferase family protein [Patescibacteria group bacterium]|nr:queuine tRNA-ribosyltransferase family protein [Patescibacteria group bacterium]
MAVTNFEINKKDKDTAARTGVLATAHGQVETPAFIPAGLQSVSRLVSASEMKFWGAQAVNASLYHLSLNPGENAVRTSGGLHTFLNWPYAVFCDSGAVFSETQGKLVPSAETPKNVTATEAGITFQAGRDASLRTLSPEAVMQAQVNLGADVVQALYYFPQRGGPAKTACWLETVAGWLKRSRRQYEKSLRGGKPLFFAALPELPQKILARAVQEYFKIDIDGIGLVASPWKLSARKLREKFLTFTSSFQQDLPKQAIDLSDTAEMVAAVAGGFDLFDSLAPNCLAEVGTAVVAARSGEGYWTLELGKSPRRPRPEPIDSACECFACQRSSRQEIFDLLAAGDHVGRRLLLMHNLRFFLQLFERIRRSITYESFGGLADRFQKVRPEEA